MKVLKIKYLFILVLLCLMIAAVVMTKRYLKAYTSDFDDHVIYSQVLAEERKIFVRLPKGYDKSKRYPLIIRTDGNFNLDRWHESIASQSEQGIIEDSILVSIPNLFWTDTRNRDLVPPYARQDVRIEARPASESAPELFGKADLFLAFVETEVLPFVEQNYSVSDNRVLSGFSAGGSFVLYTIVTKPDLFTGYFAFSPAAWYDDSVVVDEFSQHLNNTSGSPKFIYLSIGGAENDIITGSFEGLLSALEQHAPANLHSGHSYSEGANHVENPYISVPKALAAYYEFRAKNISQ